MLTMTSEKKPAGHNRWEGVRRSTADQVADQRRWARAVLDGATLGELRELAGQTQAQVAGAVGVSQVEAGRAERRPDLQLSTLRRYLAALGFDLEVLARSREHPERAIPVRFSPPAAAPAERVAALPKHVHVRLTEDKPRRDRRKR